MDTFILDEKLTEKTYQQIPYAKFIGLRVGYDRALQQILFHLPFKEMLIGNTLLPAIHGGLTGGFMESCAATFLQLNAQLDKPPKTVDFSLDYLRFAKAADLYATCSLTRKGSRISHVTVRAWQKSPDYPVALGRVHFLSKPD